MGWDVNYSCDICGKPKREANHWWMVMLGDVPCFEQGQPARRFTLLPWNAAEAAGPNIHHLCGESCAMKAMERFMSSGEIFPEKVTRVG